MKLLKQWDASITQADNDGARHTLAATPQRACLLAVALRLAAAP
jgi:hypothetical protein